MIGSINYTKLLKINDEYYTFNELSQNNILPSLNHFQMILKNLQNK